jgi:hypothetical protein
MVCLTYDLFVHKQSLNFIQNAGLLLASLFGVQFLSPFIPCLEAAGVDVEQSASEV